jgi:hypothetical protein
MIDISQALAADIDDLAIAFDVSDTNHDSLADAAQTLYRDIRLAVRSFLGMSIAFDIHGEPITVSLLEDDLVTADVGSSMRFPLTHLGPLASSNGTAVLYAERPGAFADLAADLTFVLDLPDDELVLDDDPLPAVRSDLEGLRRLNMIHQAVGVLVGRGYTAEEALAELRRVSGPDGSLWSAAQEVVAVR